VWDLVEKEQVNAVSIVGDAMAVPLLEALETHPGRWNLSALFNVGSGGAVFSEAKQERFRTLLPNVFVYNSFGSSESGATGPVAPRDPSASGLGRMMQSEFLDVLVDDNGRLRRARPGETGILARSGHIPIGYYKDPEKTAKTFVEADGKQWILTGDAATLEEDGSTMTVFGRGSNCIESGGEKVFPEEVEQAIKAHPDVLDALVVGTPDERWGNKVTAVIATRGNQPLTLASLQQEARKHIAGYKVPRELHIVAEVPRTPSGKPNYVKAKELALSGSHRVA
jgi:acyl-CoA synthetase (AMP-forming)/AMP-acid ligase II